MSLFWKAWHTSLVALVASVLLCVALGLTEMWIVLTGIWAIIQLGSVIGYKISKLIIKAWAL